MVPFELHTHMCVHVMHTWLLPLQNDLRKKIMNVPIKLYFMMYDVSYYLHFWYNSQYTI